MARVAIGSGNDEPDVAAVFDALAACLERQERFALVVVMPPVPPSQRRRPELKRLMWLKRHKAEIADRCAGIGYVLPADLRADAPPADRAAKVFGCPVELFEHEPDAAAWATVRLGEPVVPACDGDAE